ncbi:MAG: glucose-6-phosphate isomerase [Phycisphaerae bacterium]|nr:glucose-6-phosphate isomerase [Phycisphaerae bacterium]
MDMLHVDFSGCGRERIGSTGLGPEDLAADRDQLVSIVKGLRESDCSGMEGWRRLPHQPLREQHLTSTRAVVENLEDRVENLVILGIGGSALGSVAVQAALNPLTWNLLPTEERSGPRLFVLDNIDPDLVGSTLREVRRVDPQFERTIFNVVSKSGETAETAAQFAIVQSMLEGIDPDTVARRIVATTDPVHGTLRRIADDRGWTTLPIPDGVGGRFSVLSPVGLFPAMMCGIDAEGLLAGAAAMDAACLDGDPDSNPAMRLAWTLVAMERHGRRNHVLMPYSNRLVPLVDWYRQLWAESLGKRKALDGAIVHAGGTPIRALGATDQHSQVQLYREGPDDKVFGFVALDAHDERLPIPSRDDAKSLQYLGGHDLAELLTAERRATEYAFAESNRPCYTIRIPRLDAPSIGQFIWLWQMATAIAGGLLGIDPYDQPAVETGKQATFGLMGRPGFEEWPGMVQEKLG